MLPLSAHFDQFLRERVYLHNVTPKTAEWYRSVWQVFAKWWVTLPTNEEPHAVLCRSDLYVFLRELGLPRSGFHLLRHTFATQYLRAGGDVVRLSIILGHSEITTTMKYLHLLTEDLQRPHQG